MRCAAVSKGVVGSAEKLLVVGRQAAEGKGVTTVERPGDGTTFTVNTLGPRAPFKCKNRIKSSSEQHSDKRDQQEGGRAE